MEIDPMRQEFLKAQYKGNPGFGYTQGNVYTFALYELNARFNKTISIYPLFPRTEGGMGVNYPSFMEFLDNWDHIEHVPQEKLKIKTDAKIS